MLESNLSAHTMAGQYPERGLRKRRSVPNHPKWVLACPKAINSAKRKAARSASA
jgi:hypothetical protein